MKKSINPRSKARNQKSVSGLTRRQFLKMGAAGVAAIGLGSFGFPAIAIARTSLKVGYIPILDHLALTVSHARDNNSFKHIDVEPKMFKRWDDVRGALDAGVIDAAFLLSNYSMDAFNKGMDIRTILVGHRHGSAIVMKKVSGMSSPDSLKGKTIAIPANISTHHALLDRYLRKGGLSLKDVTTRVIAPPDMVKALEGGGIDGYIVAEPWCAKAEIEGTGKILVLSKDILKEHICCVVVVRSSVLKENPSGIQEWVDSLIRNGRFIDLDKTQNSARNITPIADKYMGHKESIVREVLLNPLDRITYSDLNPRLEDYRAILEMSQKAGVLGDVDLERFIDSRFYKESNEAKG